jgi:hypothetical protein
MTNKKTHPTVWHNSFVKSISNLHQEPERNKYVSTLPPLENLNQEPFLKRKDVSRIATRICVRGVPESVFSNLG